MKNQITIILGAGFSANAGMPTANDIAIRFNRDLKEKLLVVSSSEWFWVDDKSENFIHNGRLNYDYLAYSYVFDELVKSYIAYKGEFVYYEDFYQYIIDNFENPDWTENLFETAKNSLLKDKPFFLEEKNREYYKSYLFAFDHKQYFKVNSILNYLIGDILDRIPKENDELNQIFEPFIKYIKLFDEVNIFTLNHDLLLERLLDLNGLNYSKGFNIENSPIIHNDEPVPYFNNQFKEKIKIHKLHGSLDFFEFRYYKKDEASSQAIADCVYFRTTNYSTKHNAQLIDSQTKEILQDYNFDIVPKFITGTKKLEIIRNNVLFQKLFENFENVITSSDNLFISGYSFSDEHLNEKLKTKEFNFINHNRSKEYPFGGNGKNIKSLDDL